MARTLICHVPPDAAVAREVGALLMGRGHAVSFDGEPDSPRHDRFTRLRLFDAVIVVWTENSAANGSMADIATHALHANLLVAVRSEGLDVARLPLAFRKLNVLRVADADAIVRVVVRLSAAAASLKEMREREGRLPRPAVRSGAGARLARRVAVPPPLPLPRLVAVAERLPEVGVQAGAANLDRPVRLEVGGHRGHEAFRAQADFEAPGSPGTLGVPEAAAGDSVLRAVSSRLALRIPRNMRIGEPDAVAVRFGCRSGGEELPAVETVSVSLYAKGGAFEIRRGSEVTQSVAGAPSRQPDFTMGVAGHWEWLVTPLIGGIHSLSIRISASLRDGEGALVPAALPDRDVEVVVSGAGYEPEPVRAIASRFRAFLSRWGWHR